MSISYRLTTGPDQFSRAFGITEDRLGAAPVRDHVHPDDVAPVIRISGSDLVAEPMRWGFPPNPKSRRATAIVANPESPYWQRWLLPRGHRCLVPATSFGVLGGWAVRSRREYCFTVTGDDALCALAGVWRPWRGTRSGLESEHLLFALLTCRPNTLVTSVRAKAMPVVMTASDEFDLWLHAPWETARGLIRPLASEGMMRLD